MYNMYVLGISVDVKVFLFILFKVMTIFQQRLDRTTTTIENAFIMLQIIYFAIKLCSFEHSLY